MRREISNSSLAGRRAIPGGSVPSFFAASVTSAKLRAGRAVVPPKMTSSISSPRSRRADVSPMTQRSASTRFDLPQPFGPTIPVIPGSMSRSTGSTKDLKPTRRRLVNCTAGSVESLFLQQRFDLVLKFLVGAFSHDPIIGPLVEDESRRGVDLQFLVGLQ